MIQSSPIVAFICAQRNLGVKTPVIIERLLKQGVPYKDVRAAIISLRKASSKRQLDWRSPTAINETARIIRNDIRRGKITYAFGQTILLRARNMLKTIIKNSRADRRLAQINYEIGVTKRLLLTQYADPRMVANYRMV